MVETSNMSHLQQDIAKLCTSSEVSTGHDNIEEQSSLAPNPLQNELLCFLQKRCNVVAYDDLVAICANFYTCKEIETARTTVASYVSDKRLPRHKGSDRDKNKKCVSDLLKLCLDPTCQLPEFYALEIARLPPVGVDHIDVGALLQEITGLRQEVRNIANVRTELDALNSSLNALREDVHELQSTQASLSTLRHDLDDLKMSFLAMRQEISAPVPDDCRESPATTELHREVRELHESLSAVRQELQCLKASQPEMATPIPLSSNASDFPPLTSCTVEKHSPLVSNGGQHTQSHTMAQLFPPPTQMERSRSTVPPRNQTQPVPDTSRHSRRNKPVVGRNNQSTLKSAATRQSRVHMFITRLSIETTADDVSDTVHRALLAASGGTITEPHIDCEALRTKHDSYMSFHIAVGVQPATKDGVIDILNSADTWPDGVLVRRYFINNRNG